MPDYQKMYYTLFNAMSESVETMMQAMQKVDEMYMDAPQPVRLLSEAKIDTETDK